MTLEEQISIIQRYAEEAYYSQLEFLRTHKEQIIQGMVPRLIAGFETYRDLTWRRSHEELERERLYETIDHNNYAAMDLHNRDQAFIKWGE
jgi:cyclophilin family peptidyl-prolyl cis-trans isomerase